MKIFGQNAESDIRGTRNPQSLCGEFLFDEPMQMITNNRMIEALDDFVQKAGDEEALGDLCRNSACAEIEEFVFIDLARGCAVGASDIVGQNFETWH